MLPNALTSAACVNSRLKGPSCQTVCLWRRSMMQDQVQGPTVCLCRPQDPSEGHCSEGRCSEGHRTLTQSNRCLCSALGSSKGPCESCLSQSLSLDPDPCPFCRCGPLSATDGPCDFSGTLPSEMSEQIFLQLDARSLCRAAQTCKRWHHIIEDSESLWRGQCLLLRAQCHREVERDRGRGLSWKVTLVRNYTRSRLKRDWLRGRFSWIRSANELRDVRMVPFDAEAWGEILEAELDR